jgi:protein-S-isoprenylcysteine O-methyltransferase Ste14
MSAEARRPRLASLLLRTAAFWIAAPGSVFVLGPWLVLRTSDLRWESEASVWAWVGIVLVVAGSVVMLACATDFVFRGWGTPAPYDPPRRLVGGRLYSRVRNPMYLGGVVILLGEALAFRSPALLAYGAVVWLSWHLAVVFVEEPSLRRRFGPDYEDYVRRVPRWLPRRRGAAAP